MDVGEVQAWTGTMPNGSPHSLTCDYWNQGSSIFRALVGHTTGGPAAWTSQDISDCDQLRHIYCFMKTVDTAPARTRVEGKSIFLSNSNWGIDAGVSADELCEASKPPDAGVVRAMLPMAVPPRRAAYMIDAGANYVRPDGQLVGTGQQIIASLLGSGVWQHGNGTYSIGNFGAIAWTGTGNPGNLAASPAETCGDWTNNLPDAGTRFGFTNHQNTWWWGNTSTSSRGRCNLAHRLYCVEE
jgi:hypothetical protein